jgi:hypothetical protein
MFCEESYNTFPTLLSFITKLNSNQLNMKKKSTNIILEKNFTKKNTKEIGKTTCEEKLYQSIVFCEEKLVFTCNCIFLTSLIFKK